MPYKIVKRKNKYLVINKQTGKVKGTHSTRAKALKHLKALYWATSGERKNRKNKKRKK